MPLYLKSCGRQDSEVDPASKDCYHVICMLSSPPVEGEAVALASLILPCCTYIRSYI